ncbi:glucosaminidase domain-containing protein [Promineifilum sp.]|uniref:glucosaminidase domain-containing protein n=1 Tax=Promineifilum sp. TaxID=2664178 RepID=UPI0035AEE9E9
MIRPRVFFPLLLLILLAVACSRETRQEFATRVLPSAGTAAAEGAVVLRTAAVEAAQTNAPVAKTLAAEAVRTGGPIVRTVVSEGAIIGGTIGAEALATGGPLARTAVARGIEASETRAAQEPSYRCPDVAFTVDTDLNVPVDISGAQLDAAIAATVPGSPLIGLGDAFVDAARARGLNAYYVAAHAAWDSAWGTSAVATRKNNLFGYGVTPACPYDCAVPFNSQAESIDFVTTLVKADYLTLGGRFYTTPTLRGMEPIYSGATNWDDGVAAIMNLLRQNTPCP